jgi:hypothetical protein
MKVPAFGDIGKNCKEILTNSYNFDQKYAFAGKTDSGQDVTFTLTKKTGGASNVDIKVAGKMSSDVEADVTFGATTGKVSGNLKINPGVEGLKIAFASPLLNKTSFTLSPKATVDYVIPSLTTKFAFPLTLSPAIDFTATTGTTSDGQIMFGGVNGCYDMSKSALTKFDIGGCVNASKYQAGFILADHMSTVKTMLAMPVTNSVTTAAECSYSLSSGDTAYSVGWAQKKPDGILYKGKFDNAGKASFLFETELRPKQKLSTSIEMDTCGSSNAKLGVGLDIKA